MIFANNSSEKDENWGKLGIEHNSHRPTTMCRGDVSYGDRKRGAMTTETESQLQIDTKERQMRRCRTGQDTVDYNNGWKAAQCSAVQRSAVQCRIKHIMLQSGGQWLPATPKQRGSQRDRLDGWTMAAINQLSHAPAHHTICCAPGQGQAIEPSESVERFHWGKQPGIDPKAVPSRSINVLGINDEGVGCGLMADEGRFASRTVAVFPQRWV